MRLLAALALHADFLAAVACPAGFPIQVVVAVMVVAMALRGVRQRFVLNEKVVGLRKAAENLEGRGPE